MTRYLSALQRLLASPTRPKLGLDRMRALLAAVGDPQERFGSLHIAGTKGKGSVCALAASMCRADGLRVGVTTSPHLCAARERIAIDNADIDPDSFADLAADVERAAAALGADQPSFFEKMIAMAFRAFADANVDIAVVEVGLGGRLDATNVITPRACAITRLGLDHTEWLGPALVHIATEKAGILKPGVPAFTIAQESDAMRVLEQRAAAVAARLQVVTRRRDLEVALVGAHQQENASLAAALVASIGVGDAAIRAGARAARVPGRYETVRATPLQILDGAHNAISARALGDAIRSDARIVGRSVALVIGMTTGHDAAAFADALGELPLRKVIAVRGRSPRSQPASDVARAWSSRAPTSIAASLRDALRDASDGPQLVSGSLYVVGEARSLVLGVPSDPAFPLF